MSTTLEGIDARGYLAGWLAGVTGMFAADIKAMPEDKWTATQGGCTRPTNELAADAICLLFWCADALEGNVNAASEEDLIKKLATEIGTREAAVAKLMEGSEKLAAAIKGASDETMNTVVTPPWQMPAPLFILAQITVSHIWYHDGQLNYIQCLLGDDKIHWMGD